VALALVALALSPTLYSASSASSLPRAAADLTTEKQALASFTNDFTNVVQ
jgi:hypothetical protein